MRRLTGFLFSMLLVTLPGHAAAQSDYGGGWAVPSLDTSIAITNDVINREITNEIIAKEGRARESGRRSADDRPNKRSTNLDVLAFTPSLSLRNVITAQFSRSVAASNPGSLVPQFLSRGGAITGVSKQMAALGLSSSNLGDSTAFFIATHWAVSRGQTSLPSRASMNAFKADISAKLAAQPRMAVATNVSKQQQSDTALLLTAIVQKAMNEAVGNPRATAITAASARQTLKAMGFDPAKFDLTPQGLVLVK